MAQLVSGNRFAGAGALAFDVRSPNAQVLKFTAKQGLLGHLQCLGFGFALFEGGVEDVHQGLGPAVIDLPEGRDRGLGPRLLKWITAAKDSGTGTFVIMVGLDA
jgi:hypothetical protein